MWWAVWRLRGCCAQDSHSLEQVFDFPETKESLWPMY